MTVDPDDMLDDALQGWAGPPPADDFARRVATNVSSPAGSRWSRWAIAFVLGAFVGGAVVGWAGQTSTRRNDGDVFRFDRAAHLSLASGSALFAEAGTQVVWGILAGTNRVEVVQGDVWLRLDPERDEIFADGERLGFHGPCAHVVVKPGIGGGEVDIDDVACSDLEDRAATLQRKDR